jgi:hypothetical protein
MLVPPSRLDLLAAANAGVMLLWRATSGSLKPKIVLAPEAFTLAARLAAPASDHCIAQKGMSMSVAVLTDPQFWRE